MLLWVKGFCTCNYDGLLINWLSQSKRKISWMGLILSGEPIRGSEPFLKSETRRIGDFPSVVLALKKLTEFQSHRKGILLATWESLEMDPSLVECPDKNIAQQTPWFQLCETMSRLENFMKIFTWKVWDNKCALFYATKFMVMCCAATENKCSCHQHV